MFRRKIYILASCDFDPPEPGTAGTARLGKCRPLVGAAALRAPADVRRVRRGDGKAGLLTRLVAKLLIIRYHLRVCNHVAGVQLLQHPQVLNRRRPTERDVRGAGL